MSDALFKDDMRKQGCYKIRKEVFIGWVTPPDGWVMLINDGAMRGNPGDAVTRSELLAFIRGITMARDIGIKKLFIKVNSQVVVQLMECDIANRAADWLANRGCEQEERLLMFDSAPPNLGLILLEDIKGVTWHRSIVASAYPVNPPLFTVGGRECVGEIPSEETLEYLPKNATCSSFAMLACILAGLRPEVPLWMKYSEVVNRMSGDNFPIQDVMGEMITVRDVLNSALDEEMITDPNVFVMALPLNLNFSSITGNYSEGGIFTASYG
ncbi:non-LTR retroelement reverse transcriptase [Tanacetum coccineum]